ncbi:MAG: FtsX-like permease family protein [Bryobacteraceae bacterium]|nr:FtsX-like permease family protein [Bryobacteraceae bacterium]MDW8380015.1 FtsX-like permease family protein [Bryobacterales bacterium]
MILLRLLSWPYVRKHKLRTSLTIAGIALGVLVFVAMRTANNSVLYGFQQTVERIAGKAQLQISSGETGFPEEVLEKVQALPEVEVAVPVIEANLNTGRKGQGNLLVLAVDMTGDRSLRQYEFEEGEEAVVDDPLVFLAQPDSIIVTREFAAANGLTTNSKIRLETMDGPKQFTVRGIMKSGGLASAFGGNLAIMDIYAAQKVFGRGRTFDRIDLKLKPEISLEAGKAALQQALGPGFQIEPPSSRGKQFEAIAKLFGIAASLNSLFALLIGLFIIYNTFAVAVAQRRSEIGILRSLGASRNQIRGLFLSESVIMGLVGSLLGIVLGLLLAQAMSGYISTFLSEIYGVAQHTEEIAADPLVLVSAALIGIATSLAAAWIPANDAATADPVKAIHKGAWESFTDQESRLRLLGAVAFIIVAALCSFTGGKSGFRLYLGYLSVVLAAVMLTPAAVKCIVRLLRPLWRWLLPVEGALATDSLLQTPRRTSATVAAVMLSLSLVIGLGGVAAASYRSILDWMTAALNPDLFVGSSEQIADRSFRFPPEIGEQLQKLDFIDEVQMVRSARVLYKDTPVMMVSTSLESLRRRIRPKAVAGDLEKAYREAARGEGVILSDNLALQHGLKVGDIMEISSPSGVLKLPVLAITIDYSDQRGALLMERSLYIEKWKDPTVNLFRVYLKPGVAPEEAKRRILERFAQERKLFVMTNQQVRDYILRITDQWFGLTYMQIFVAVLVAVLGIVNSLTVSITDRRRELAVLQAVGGLRRQVRQAVWMEALGIGAVSLVLGLLLGAVILQYYLDAIREDLAGMRLDYYYPTRIALLLVPTMLITSFVSALWPAETAVRTSLVEALEYE